MFNLGFMYISTKFATLNADTWRALYSKLIKCDLKQCERIQTAKSLKKNTLCIKVCFADACYTTR